MTVLDRFAWLGLGIVIGGLGVIIIEAENERRQEKEEEKHPSNEPKLPRQYASYMQRPEPGRFRQPEDKKRKPGITISIDPRKKTDQPLVKLEWEKKNK